MKKILVIQIFILPLFSEKQSNNDYGSKRFENSQWTNQLTCESICSNQIRGQERHLLAKLCLWTGGSHKILQVIQYGLRPVQKKLHSQVPQERFCNGIFQNGKF